MDDRQLIELQWTVIGYLATALLALLVLVFLWFATPGMRQRWFPLPRLQPGTWAGHEVFLTFCVLIGFRDLVMLALFHLGFFNTLIGPPPDLDVPGEERTIFHIRSIILASPLTVTVALGTIFLVLFARKGARPHHFGLSWARWPANVALGLFAFVAATPIVLFIFFLATLIVRTYVPLRTPPMELLQRVQLENWEWLLIAFETTVAAPVLEEVVFRGILQGWLRRASLTGHLAIMTAAAVVAGLGMSYDVPAEGVQVFDPTPLFFALALAAWYGYRMFVLAKRFRLNETEIQDWSPQGDAVSPANAIQPWRDANARLAVHGSAMLFASFHFDSWPGPVALFFLALVLGDLARRTQSLIGPITLHALFNLVAFIALFGGSSQVEREKGNAQTIAARPSLADSTLSSVPASQLPLRK